MAVIQKVDLLASPTLPPSAAPPTVDVPADVGTAASANDATLPVDEEGFGSTASARVAGDGSGSADAPSAAEYLVRGIVRRKLVFKTRPHPVVDMTRAVLKRKR